MADAITPQLLFANGGVYTLDISSGHPVVKILPISPSAIHESHRHIQLHPNGPHDPPSVINRTYENALIQNPAVVHRPNVRTPSTFRWHLRWACASIKKLRDIHSNVDGMEVQQGTWNRLKDLLPCEACVAGKLRKFHHTRPSEFFPIESLATRAQSTNSIDEVGREQNDIVSVDWGIVLSECRKKNIVFALCNAVFLACKFSDCKLVKFLACGKTVNPPSSNFVLVK